MKANRIITFWLTIGLIVIGIIGWMRSGGIEGFIFRQFKKGMDESGEEKARQLDVIEAHKTSIHHKGSIMGDF